jgi:hypothetical protein
MIAAILVEGITDDGSRATVDAENYSGFPDSDFRSGHILIPGDALVL